MLGRLEYQRGNFDAALQVFQGIDIRGLRAKMAKAIAERTRPRRARSKGQHLQTNLMSMHSVTLILEAMLLKSKSLEGLGRARGNLVLFLCLIACFFCKYDISLRYQFDGSNSEYESLNSGPIENESAASFAIRYGLDY